MILGKITMNKVAVIVSASLLAVSTAPMAKIYVGGKVGESWFNNACRSTDTCDDNKEAGGVFLGYQVLDTISVEAGYDYLGKISAAGINDDSVSAVTLAPKFSIPITEQFSAYIKAGGAYVDYGSKDDMSYLGAVGVEYQIHSNIRLRLEYQKLTDINNDIVKANNNLATIGVTYQFGESHVIPPARPVADNSSPIETEAMPETVKPHMVTAVYKKELNSSNSFALNSAKLTDKAKSELIDVIHLLNQYPQAVVHVTGHTDATGAEQYNQKLSERRASAVADYLTEHDVDISRITIKGMGELQPIASNSTQAGRNKNRRVEIVIPEFEYKATNQS